ncbi:MAG TPA: PhzF family phenazine biosynthesis protein [Tepidisphaeraceae bacterium]|nr:PhzF family phenazine biosynthesis protein [Tepidisphaeraceae bacterium]
MPFPIFHVDAFTDKPFAGNPAAVCLLEKPADEKWMQRVAMEMNLSETAYLYPVENGFSLRWFTPAIEVALCGHATLASAHILWETGRLKPAEPARFHTKSGLLTCVRRGDWIEMDFPAIVAEPAPPPKNLLESLGIKRGIVARGGTDYLVQIDSEAELRSLKPDFAQLKLVEARGVTVTARSSGEFDFISRFFAPAAGIDEDPVTGSAHCRLAPWWQKKLGKNEMLAFQASRRGGIVKVKMAGDRVIIGGQAVTTLRGELVC